MDILTLPIYREGFPNTPLEAAAMELPVVATTVDGCVEAVADQVTGFLVPSKNSRALAQVYQNSPNNGVKKAKKGLFTNSSS